SAPSCSTARSSSICPPAWACAGSPSTSRPRDPGDPLAPRRRPVTTEHNLSPQTSGFDVVVLGSGPGGEGAAMLAAKAGKRVALLLRFRAVGGGCTHLVTIPSKALREAVRTLKSLRQNPMFADLMVAR